MRRIASLLLALALSGCASGGFGTMDGIMASWAGASVDEVIAQWGYPAGERDVAGRKLLYWTREVSTFMPGIASSTSAYNPVAGAVQTTTTFSGGGMANWSCTRILEIKDDKVKGWQWEGNNCPFMEAGPYANWRRK